MSGQVEYYVGMRVIAQGREGTISRVLNSGYDVSFPDGQVAHNLPAASITPFDTAPVNKQVDGPPPPMYSPNTTSPPPPQYQQQSMPQYQYPTSQPYQQQQQQPMQVQTATQSNYVGSTSAPVVYGVASNPVVVNTNTSQPATTGNKVPGFEFSPDVGQPFSSLCDCDCNFWMACCCPCITGGQVAEKVKFGTYAMVCGGYIFTCVILFILSLVVSNGAFFLILWIGWSVFVLMLRLHVKKMWQMSGGAFEDCCVTFCCLSCSLAQVCHQYQLHEKYMTTLLLKF